MTSRKVPGQLEALGTLGARGQDPHCLNPGTAGAWHLGDGARSDPLYPSANPSPCLKMSVLTQESPHWGGGHLSHLGVVALLWDVGC